MRFNHIWLTKTPSRENQLKNVGQTNLRLDPFFRCLFIICGHQKINGSCKTDYITPKNKRNPPAELNKFGLTSLEINCLATLIHWGIKVIAPTHTFYIQPYLFNVFVCVNHSRVHRTTECPLVVCVSNRQVFCLLISEFPPINWVYYDGISSRFVVRSQSPSSSGRSACQKMEDELTDLLNIGAVCVFLLIILIAVIALCVHTKKAKGTVGLFIFLISRYILR